jgi:hypothetical protein
MAIEAGVSALELVSEMPSGPGMIAEAQIAVESSRTMRSTRYFL